MNLDAIRDDIEMAARSPEMARHVALDHGPELLAEVERLRMECREWEYAAIENGKHLARLSAEADEAWATIEDLRAERDEALAAYDALREEFTLAQAYASALVDAAEDSTMMTVQRVRALHFQSTRMPSPDFGRCITCRTAYPCETIRALGDTPSGVLA